MLLFYCNEALIKGNEFVGQECPACSTNKWRAVSAIKYLSFTILPLFPFKTVQAKECRNCFRVIEHNDQAYSYPTITKRKLASTLFGLPVLALIFSLITWYISFIEQQQEKVRSVPKHGDILFINYFKLTQDDRETLYPIRIAKVERFDRIENKVTMKISSFKYKYRNGATLDYRGRSYLFGSFFAKKELTVPVHTLSNRTVFYDVKRPFYNIDVELFQKDTKFEKEFAEYPRE